MSHISVSVTDFARQFDRSPAGVWSAPGRVNLIGEHTDYNGGFVLPFAIQSRTAVAAIPRSDGRVSVRSRQSPGEFSVSLEQVRPEQLTGWSAYPLGVVWAFMEHMTTGEPVGADLFIHSDVPIGAGLSSSAAIEAAVAVALQDLWGTKFSPGELARLCQQAENVAVGAPTGIMDQTVSIMGKAGHALFLDCSSGDTEQVPVDLSGDGLTIVVMDTGVKHDHATGGYGERRKSCESASRSLGVRFLRDVTVAQLEVQAASLDEVTYRRARHVVSENARVLSAVEILRAEGPRALGPVLLDSHQSMRDDFEISCDELNLAVDIAMDCGAIGARMTGGGFGGSAIAIIELSRLEALSQRLSVAFSQRGYARPRSFTVTPSAGAGRDL